MSKRPKNRSRSRQAFIRMLRENLWGDLRSNFNRHFEWLRSLVVRRGRVRVPALVRKAEPKRPEPTRQLMTPEGLEVRKLLAGDVAIVASGNADEGDFFGGGFIVAHTAGVVAEDLTVEYSFGGTADTTLDYVPLTGTAVIPTGSSIAEIDVKAFDDNLLEPTETVEVALTSAYDSDETFTVDSATSIVNILDQDQGTLVIDAVDAVADELGDPGQFILSISGDGGVSLASSTDTTISLSISGSATNGTDYDSIPAVVTLAAGDESLALDVDAIADSDNFEGDEEVVISITGIATSHPSLSSDATPATVTIEDPARPIASISSSATTVDEGDAIVYEVSLDSAAVGDVTLGIEITGDVDGDDFVETIPLAVTIADGDTTAAVTLTTDTDGVLEDAEDVDAELTYIGGSVAVDGGANTANATINASDPGTLVVSGPGSVSESVGTATLTFALDGGVVVDSDTTITFDVVTDAEGTDYTLSSSEAVILAGSSVATVEVAVNDDAIVENDETLEVSITGQTSGAAIASLSTDVVTMTIEDNDEASYTITGGSAVEGDDIVFAVSLSNEVEHDAVLDYSLTDDSASLVTGDYSGPATGKVTIAGGSDTAAITVSALDDSLVESEETFDIDLTGVDSSMGSVVAGGAISAVGTIVDNDAAVVNLQAPVPTVNEPASLTSSENFLVVLNHPVAVDTTVVVDLSAGTADSPDDYSPDGATVTIAAGSQVASIAIDIESDALIEDDETVIASIVSVDSGTLAVSDGSNATMTIVDEDYAELSLTATDITVTEGVGAVLTLDQGVEAQYTDTVIEYTLIPGSASTLDYTSVTTGTATIAAGDTTTDITISTIDESLVESDESFTVALSIVSSDPQVTLVSPDATITIEDNDSLEASISGPTTVAELDGGDSTTLSYDISLSSVSGEDVVVYIETADGTASAGSDYDGVTQAVTITAGDTTASIDVVVNGDDAVEPDENFDVAIVSVDASGADASVSGGSGSVSVDIIDDDSAGVTLTGPATVAEDVGEAIFTLSMSAPSSVETVVDITTNDGSAAAGDDFGGLSSEPVTIAANATTATFAVSITDDSVDEAIEDFGVSAVIGDSNGADVTIDSGDVSVDITDNDDAKVTVTALADSVTEGGSAEFEISLSESSAPVTIYYETADGDATAPADYTAVTDSIVLAGDSATTVSIGAIFDGDVELPEDFSLTITSIEGSPDHTPMVLTGSDDVTIVDADSTTVSLSGPASIDEDAGPAVFSIAVGERTQPIVVSYTTSPGTAVDVDDFTATSGLVTIAPTVTLVEIPVTLTDDNLLEDTEDFGFSISLVDDGGVAVSVGVTDVSTDINDTDTADLTVSRFFDAAETNGGATGLTGRFLIELSNPSETDTFVTYVIDPSSTAEPTDYIPLSGTAFIPAGSVSVNVDVVPVNDTLVEGDETVVLSLTSFGGDPDIVIDPTTASVTIEDNDVATVDVTGVTVDEDAGQATLTIALSKPSETPVTVTYNLTGSADDPSDYSDTGDGTVTFAASSTIAQEVVVDIVDDTIVEGTEDVVLSLESITGNSAVTAGVGTESIVINDNDSASVSIIAADSPIPESDDAQFIVLLSSVAQEDVTVTIDLSGTVDGDDYTSPVGTTGTVVIPGGSSSGSLFVTIDDDNLVESNETLIGTISSISGVGDLSSAAPTAATIVIDDNDLASATVADAVTVAEADGTATIDVTLSNPSDSPTVIEYSLTDGTATEDSTVVAGDDYDGTTGLLTLTAGQTVASINVDIVDDDIVEGDESFTLTLTSIVSGDPSISVGTPGSTTIEITDDDSAEVTITSGLSVVEGTTTGTTDVTLTISQSSVSSTDTTVTYSTTADTADASDYNDISGATAVIPAGSTEATVVVEIIPDSDVEPNEEFTVDIDGVAGDDDITVGTPAASDITILDDDSAIIRLPATASVFEDDGEVVLLVSLTDAASSTLTIDYDVAITGVSDTDAEAADFPGAVLPSGQLTIDPGETLVPLTIAILDEGVVELDETFEVAISNLQGSTSISIDPAFDTSEVTIGNDDQAALRILTADGPGTSIAESGGTTDLFFLSLSDESSTATTVTYSVTGDATSGDDYVAIPTVAVVPAGVQSYAIPVTINDDSFVENDEVITISLQSTSNDDIVINLSLNDVADATILNDDGEATLTSSQSAETVTEGTDVQFLLTLSAPAGSDTVVSYDLVGSTRFFSPDNPGPGPIGEDTTTTFGTGSVVIPAGSTSIAIDVDVIDDSLVERVESLTIENVSVVSGTSNIVDSTTDHTVTVEDNDDAELVLVGDLNGTEGSTDGRFRLILTNPLDEDMTVSATDVKMGPLNIDDAIPGTDFTTLPTTVVVPAGVASFPVDVTITNDLDIEIPEKVTYKLESIVSDDFSGSLTLVDGSDEAIVTIFDNDAATLTLSDTSIVEGTGSVTAGDILISLSDPVPVPTTVAYKTVDGSAVGVDDYVPTTNVVTIAAGATTAAVPFEVIADSTVESDEDFQIELVSVVPNTAGVGFAPGEAGDITVLDDDTAEVDVVNVSIEEGDDIWVTVSLTNLSDTPTTVTLGATDGTAEPTDYAVDPSVAITAVIPANTATASVSVGTTDDDSLFEGGETVLVSVTAVDSSNSVSEGDEGTVTILDNDLITVSVEPITSPIDETAGPTDAFLVSVDGNIDEDVTVLYDLGGTADEVDDYAALAGSVVVPSGALTAVVSLDPVADTINELDETVVLSVSTVDGVIDSSVVTGDDAEVTIEDNNTPELTVSFTPSSLEEGDSATLSFDLDLPATDDFTLFYSVGGDASDPADYDGSGLGGSVVFSVGESSVDVTISTVDDSLIESDETVEVSLGSVDSAASLPVVLENTETTLTIVDNEDALVTVSKITDGVEPGDLAGADGVFLINLSNPALTDTTVFFDIGGTATEIDDYADIPTSVVIPAGDVDAYVTIAPESDTLVEGNETVEISLTSVDGDPLIEIVDTSDDNAFLTIRDADFQVVEVEINGGDVQRSRVTEMTVLLNGEVDATSQAAKFAVENRDTLDPVDIAVTDSYDPVTGQTLVTITFTGAGADATGSLEDGNFRLTITGDLVDVHGNTLDGNANDTGEGTPTDDYVFGDSASDGFFRFFGDTSGDRTVGFADVLEFLAVNGTAVAAGHPLDLNQDGTIGFADVIGFITNNGGTLSF